MGAMLHCKCDAEMPHFGIYWLPVPKWLITTILTKFSHSDGCVSSTARTVNKSDIASFHQFNLEKRFRDPGSHKPWALIIPAIIQCEIQTV